MGSEGYAIYREIWEGPAVYRETLEALGNLDDLAANILKRYRAIIACSCGSSHHAGLALCYAASRLAGLTAYAVQASEYPAYAHHHVGSEHLLVAISQSGETGDTIRAARMAREKGVRVLAITGGAGSSLAGLADHVLPVGGGAERAVPATKSFVAQLAACYAFASALSRAAGGQDLVQELQAQPEMLQETLSRSESFAREYAESLAAVRGLFILGYGPSFIAALEASLKLKETCGIHAEAYSIWEFRHGPISLLDGERPCIMIVPPRPGDSLEAFEKVSATARGAGARVLLVSHSPLRMDVSETLTIPETRGEFATALEVAPFQLLAYYTALRRGLDPDRPRLLTKVVR